MDVPLFAPNSLIGYSRQMYLYVEFVIGIVVVVHIKYAIEVLLVVTTKRGKYHFERIDKQKIKIKN